METFASPPASAPTTPIADTVADLTPRWFTAALREHGTIGPDVSVSSAKSSLIGTGQLGQVVQSELEYDGGADAGPASLIVKLPSEDAGSRGLGAAMGVYEAEVRFYQEIAPRLRCAIPRMHWGAVEPETGRFTLVIDDLTAGSVVGDMVAGGTVDQAALAIGELAKFQTPVWDDPELRGRSWLNVARTEMLFAAVAPALDAFMERFADRLDPDHVALVERLAPKATSVTAKVWKPPFVVGHGDYRLDNMMFGRTADAPPIAVIDWQAARLAPPLLDAAIFLGSCISGDERRAHERDLLRSYHEQLLSAGITGFSLDDCWESYRGASLFPFLITVAVSVTLVRTERGDAMWARLLSGCAELAAETDAAGLLD
jgi:hypothetical protein